MVRTQRLTDEERNVEMQHLAAALFEVAGAMRRDGDLIARTAGQTQARWQVMWTANTAPLTVPSIARRLGTSRQNVQRIADEIVGDSLATFEPNPDHQRSPLLQLTERGGAILEQINKTAARRNIQLADTIGQDGVRRLHVLLEQLSHALGTAHTQ